jgi:multiple sugar transport system ATP-binding protein
MARVLLENVTKVFDGHVVAVSDFSLDVTDGEFMVIVGPSGCGKTTTLRMIAGLEKPTSGKIYIADTLVNDVPPKDRDIAMVFQNYALYPHMTVYQNMAFALKMRKYSKPEIDEHVKDTAKLLGIEHLLNRKPKALSGGQCQRVALGRAIVRNPQAFLFDEPLSNLDAQLRVSTRVELKAMHNKLRATSIYVTHDQAEAMTLGDRICVMRNGAVQQVGVPIEVYEKPVNRFVAGFIGTPPMNFFEGCVKFKNDTACFVLFGYGSGLHCEESAHSREKGFTLGQGTISLPQRLRAVLPDYRDKKMVLGVRPEHLSLSACGGVSGQADSIITATINAVEHLGTRTDVYLKNKTGADFVASIGGYLGPRRGDTVRIYIDLERIHIFEPGEMGKNVTKDSIWPDCRQGESKNAENLTQNPPEEP